MKLNYREDEGLVYWQLVDRENDYIVESISIPDTGLVLDFDKDGKLVGIESLNPEEELPEEVLRLSKQNVEGDE